MISWNDLLGSWERVLSDIISDPIVRANLRTVNGYYLNGSLLVYPSQINVFRAFKECPYDKLSVVIVLQDPYHDGSATGIPMGNEPDTRMSPSLKIVKDTISRTIYKGQDFDFDPTLIKWERQGILLLNTALTVEAGKPLSHQKLWAYFTQKVFDKLSEINSGIIYCLWGKYAESYRMYINENSNTILTSTHPVYASYRGLPWDCDHFNKINDILKKNNNLYINW